MRIGIIRDTMFTTEPRGMNIARILRDLGHEVYVLCYGNEEEIEIYQEITLDRFYLRGFLKRKLSSVIATIPVYKWIWTRKIKKFIKKHGIEVLQVHDLYMIGAALDANKSFNLPIVANFHENYAAAIKTYNWATSGIGKILVRPNIWNKLEPLYLRKISKLIVLSESYKKKLMNKYDFLRPADIVAYPNVPNLGEFDSYSIDHKLFNNEDKYTILYFGVIAERRGIFTILDALSYLKDGINLKLVLIGPVDKADRSRFFTYLDNREYKNLITHFAWREIHELPSFLVKCDLCISPILKNDQHDSGVANKIFQYMLYEKPLVVSDSEEQKRIIEENECGLIHRSGDAQDLAEKILYLHGQPKTAKQMGENGKRAVEHKYNTQFLSSAIGNLYKTLQPRD